MAIDWDLFKFKKKPTARSADRPVGAGPKPKPGKKSGRSGTASRTFASGGASTRPVKGKSRTPTN